MENTDQEELEQAREGEILEVDSEESTPEEKPRKLTARQSEREIKHAAIGILAENGMSRTAIATAVQVSRNTAQNVVTKVRRESLRSPHKLKLAGKFTDKVLKEALKPAELADPRVKTSDAVKVAEMIYKAQGEIDKVPEGTSQTFIQVNIGQYSANSNS